MTESKLIATLNYTALTLRRRIEKFKKIQDENPDFNIDNNPFLKEAVRSIEESIKEFKKII
jgi:hypothetical protein